jgi:hypothetical protein
MNSVVRPAPEPFHPKLNFLTPAARHVIKAWGKAHDLYLGKQIKLISLCHAFGSADVLKAFDSIARRMGEADGNGYENNLTLHEALGCPYLRGMLGHSRRRVGFNSMGIQNVFLVDQDCLESDWDDANLEPLAMAVNRLHPRDVRRIAEGMGKVPMAIVVEELEKAVASQDRLASEFERSPS